MRSYWLVLLRFHRGEQINSVVEVVRLMGSDAGICAPRTMSHCKYCRQLPDRETLGAREHGQNSSCDVVVLEVPANCAKKIEDFER